MCKKKLHTIKKEGDRYGKNENENEQENISVLRKKRCLLLEEIHEKQSLLDQLDYRIYQCKEQIKREGKGDYDGNISFK